MSLLGELLKVLLGVGPGKISLERNEEINILKEALKEGTRSWLLEEKTPK